MKVSVKELVVNKEYLVCHDAVPFTLRKTTSSGPYTWNMGAKFFPTDMQDLSVRIRYFIENTKSVHLDDFAMPDQPRDDKLVEDCHELTFDEISSFFESDIYKKQGTIWNIDKMYNALFQTKDTHDRIKEKYGTSVSLVYPVADCAAVRFYDVKHQVIGITHSDAVRTTGNLIGRCVQYMKSHFGSNVEDIEVFVGAFAKDDWTYDNVPLFARREGSETEMNDSWKDYITVDNGKYIINYGDKIFDQISGAGISYDNIYFDPDNTLFSDDYFSHVRSVLTNNQYPEGRNLMGITFDYDKLVEDAEENGVILR